MRAVDQSHAVFEVGALLFPQRGRTGIVDGDILCARHARLLAEKNEQRVEPPRDGEVHVTASGGRSMLTVAAVSTSSSANMA